MISLCKYYIVVSDALEGSFLNVFFLLLAVILSGLLEKPSRGGSGVGGGGRGLCGGLGVGGPFHPFSKALKCKFISF